MGLEGDHALDRREYFRRKQREHRRKIRDERTFLQEELATLEAKVRPSTLTASTETWDEEGAVLSWQAVAQVFRAATGRAKADQRDLTQRMTTTSARIHKLMCFLQACRPCPMPSLSMSLPTMQYVTLPAHPETRTTAKQWLTQQLYHNTDRVFASFPHDHDAFVHTEVHVAASHIETLEMFQVSVNLPLHLIVQGYYTDIQTRVPPSAKIDHSEVDGNTRNYRSNSMPSNAYFNVLEGHFHEANRCVLVARCLQDDETHARDRVVRYSLQWMDSRQIDANETLVRVYKVHKGDIPRAEMMLNMDVTALDDDALAIVLTNKLRTQAQESVETMPATFLQYVLNSKS
ncbi:Aste57867_12370 [Aphanomyces stellatus]|uniref:Aste57867_12370 protein n=1 Tax=Aphanomyces stellatus TaxID=120398 RepID=A0A485KW63_9STRA|nr:hypothetical protein As57867_012324 [Aphanomyces stellatus]VFT89222.1 Aste57867_12370 [Aphanomyces stellatus]